MRMPGRPPSRIPVLAVLSAFVGDHLAVLRQRAGRNDGDGTFELRHIGQRFAQGGVDAGIRAFGKQPHVVLVELFTEFGAGTLIVR